MRLVTFTESGKQRVGVLDSETGEVTDLSAYDARLPTDMIGFIAAGAAARKKAQQAQDSGQFRYPVDNVSIQAPIPRPPKNILCVGKNYPDHVAEVKSIAASSKDGSAAVPEFPIIFTKAISSVTGPGTAIDASLDSTDSVDYEGELAVVIGPGGRGISRADAMAHVYGYTIVNDVTSRRLQLRHQQWFVGKSLDGFCPMGPCLVTRDAMPDIAETKIQTHVNGELRQDGYVRDMIFDIPALIETLSAVMTLEPGDVIATGTPAGVGMGFTPPKYLKPGDVVSVTIDPVGILVNHII